MVGIRASSLFLPLSIFDIAKIESNNLLSLFIFLIFFISSFIAILDMPNPTELLEFNSLASKSEPIFFNQLFKSTYLFWIKIYSV